MSRMNERLNLNGFLNWKETITNSNSECSDERSHKSECWM